MSATSDILTAIETRLLTVFSGGEYERLRYSYNLEKNDFRTSKNGYGIGAGAASSVVGTHQTITLDQEFFVSFVRNYGGRDNDTAERSELSTIYNDLETLYRDLFQSKLGIPNTVYLVSELNLDEPENIADNVISVTMRFIVKHRKAT